MGRFLSTVKDHYKVPFAEARFSVYMENTDAQILLARVGPRRGNSRSNRRIELFEFG